MTFLSVRSRYFYFYFFFCLCSCSCWLHLFVLSALFCCRALGRQGRCAAVCLLRRCPVWKLEKGCLWHMAEKFFFFRQPVSIFSRHNALIGRLALKSIDHRQSTRRLFVLFPPGPCCCLRQSLACLRCTIYELCTDKVFGRR